MRHTLRTKKQHGGLRSPAGGRPTHYDAPMKRINVMLDNKTLAILDRIADNRSAAIRELAAHYADRNIPV